MSILTLLLLIVIAGVVLWMVNSYIPMAPLIKSLLNVLVLIFLIIYVAEFFGIIKTILPFPAFLNKVV